MAPQTAVDSKSNSKPHEKNVVPAEEPFWRRYSPHHEFPLSSLTSIVAHVLAVGVLVVAGILFRDFFRERSTPLPMDVVDAGGGGDPKGIEGATGSPAVQHGAETTKDTEPAPAPEAPKTDLKDVTPDPLDMPELKGPDSARIINESQRAVSDLKAVGEDVRKQLFRGLAKGGERSKGKGGPGTGGGLGSGEGTGTGPGRGDGSLSTRERRALRWQLNFRVHSPEDHLQQFQALGAILAVQKPGGGFWVFDLNKGWHHPREVNDLSKINRIFWIDREPHAIAGISRVLNVPPPPYLIAFFPEPLENKMKVMEEKYRGRPEDEINEHLMFDVVPRGGGYDVVIGGQS
jgi:hypothetical protein